MVIQISNGGNSEIIDEVISSIGSITNGVVGTIDAHEVSFLLSVIKFCGAHAVVEIGVSSGASSLYILAMLAKLGGERKLFSFDILDFYYGDRSREVGYLAIESEFNNPSSFCLSSKTTSVDVRKVIDSEKLSTQVDLAFIDGSHRHPWAAIDLLMLLPSMQENGIFVFHDINLPNITKLKEDYGPMYLFTQPFPERFMPSSTSNIGGIKISGRKLMIELTSKALAQPWEVELPSKEFGEILNFIDIYYETSDAAQLRLLLEQMAHNSQSK